MTGREVLLGSSFHLASEGEGSGPGPGGLGPAWPTAASTARRTRARGGSAYRRRGADRHPGGRTPPGGRMLMGVAVSLSEGEGSFDDSWATTGEQGRAESTMTTVSPLRALQVDGNGWRPGAWWAGARANMTLRFDDGSETVRRDLSMRLGGGGRAGRAAGARQHGRYGRGAEGRCVLRDDGVGAGVGRDRHDGPTPAGCGWCWRPGAPFTSATPRCGAVGGAGGAP